MDTGNGLTGDSTVHDTATIHFTPGTSFAEGGTVTYTFTGAELAALTPALGWTASNSTTWTETVTVAAGSAPNSTSVGALPAGTDYAFTAQYGGDSDYTASAPSASEPLTIGKGSTSVSTLTMDTGNGLVGDSTVYDTATIHFTPGTSFAEGGTVTYTFTGAELAALTPASGWSAFNSTTWMETVTVTAGSAPNSTPVGALPAGTDYAFTAQYSGDSDYTASAPSASEPLTIGKGSTTVSTVIVDSGSGLTGDSTVHDTATIHFTPGTSFAEGGTVTYTFTGAELAALTPASGWTAFNSTTWTETVTVAAGSAPNSASVGALPAGTDYAFSAQYSGDSDYTASAPSASEPLTIGKAASSVSTTIFDSGGGAVGGLYFEKVYDTASVTATPFTAMGTLTYYFYNTATPVYGTTTPVTTQTVNLSGGSVPNSANTASLAVGSYSYIAVYSGDNNYTTYTAAAETLTIARPTVGVSGNSTTPEGSTYSITLSPVPTTFGSGVSTSFLVVHWNDPASDSNLVQGGSNQNNVFVASPSGAATGNGSGSDPGDLLAFPGGGTLTHVYTDSGPNLSRNVGISVDLVTSNFTDFTNAGSLTVAVQDVPPTAYIGGSSPITIGDTTQVFIFGVSSPSPEAVTAGFHYAYQVYYNSNLIYSVGSTASYASGVTNSTLTIPANYFEAPGVTVDGYAIDKNGGVSNPASLPITVNNTTLTVNTGGNLTANPGVPFTQSVTFNYPDTSGLSPYTANLYQQGNLTPLATVSNVQPGVPFNIGTTFGSINTYTLYVTVSNTVGATGTSSNFTVNVQNPVLHVTSFNSLTSGFQVTFNEAVNANLLALYDGVIPNSVLAQAPNGPNTSLGAPDLMLIGQNTGTYDGSLVWNAATDTATFVASSVSPLSNGQFTKFNGVLPPDHYTLTLDSPAAPPGINGTVASGATTTTFTPVGYSGTIPAAGYMLVGGTTDRYFFYVDPATNQPVVTLTSALPSAPSTGTNWSIVTGGWQSASEQPLNGIYNSAGNYTATFNVGSSNNVILTTPSFARGPNQTLSVADDGTAGSSGNLATGLPIHISNGSGVFSVDFTLTYNPALLAVGGASLTSAVTSIPNGGWGLTINNNTMHGTLEVSASGTVALPSGGLDIIKILGTIPSTAPYGASAVLTLTDVTINGSGNQQIASAGSQSIDKAAYFGDTAGPSSSSGGGLQVLPFLGEDLLTSYDSFDISRVVVNLDTGFYAYPLTDPRIIGDVTGDPSLTGLDSSYVLQESVGDNVPQIPAIQLGQPSNLNTGGIDPTLAIPSGLVGVRGQTVNSTVAFTDDAGDLEAGNVWIQVPTNFVSIDPSQVTLSSTLQNQGFTYTANTVTNAGDTYLSVAFSGDGTALNDGVPAVFTMPFSVLQSAPTGTAPVPFAYTNLTWGQNMILTPVDGSIVILGYNWLGGKGITGHENDWSVTTNWDANIDPNAAGSTVIFGNADATGTAVLNAGNRTIGTMDFNSSTPTTITTTLTEEGTLTFDNGASDAAINASGSGHNITSLVGVMLNSDLDVAVNSNGDTLAIAGNITDGANGPKGLTKSGAGMLTLSGVNTYGGDTAVTGGVLKVTSASALPDGGNLAVGAAALTMFSSTVPEAPIAAAAAVSKVDSSTSGSATPATVTSAPQAASSSNPLVSSIATTLPAQPWIIKNAAATVANLPNIGATVKAHDAALKTWTPSRSANNSSWLAAWYDANNQRDPTNRSADVAAVDEAIIRYSK